MDSQTFDALIKSLVTEVTRQRAMKAVLGGKDCKEHPANYCACCRGATSRSGGACNPGCYTGP